MDEDEMSWRYPMVVLTMLFSLVGYALFIFWGGWDAVFRGFGYIGISGGASLYAFSMIPFFMRFRKGALCSTASLAALSYCGIWSIPFIPKGILIASLFLLLLLFLSKQKIQFIFSDLLSLGVEIFAFYLLLSWLSIDLQPWTAAGIYAVSILLGKLSRIPGGIGVTEVALWQLLFLCGVPAYLTVVTVISIRMTQFWFPMLLELLTEKDLQWAGFQVYSR